MKFLEKNLEDIVFETDNYFLTERGFPISTNGLKLRQVRLANYGIADIVNIYRPYSDHKRWIAVYELKQEKVTVSAFFQAIRYIKGIKRFLQSKNINPEIFNYCIVLVGKEIDTKHDFVYLPDIINSFNLSVHIVQYQYEFDGIRFNVKNDFRLTNEGNWPK